MPRGGVHADQVHDLHLQAGLLLDLPNGGIGDGLTEVHATAWECPQVIVGLVHQEDTSVSVGDYRRDRWHNTVGRRGVRIVIIIDTRHSYPPTLRGTGSVVVCQTRSKAAR